jgi:hypothetical protein
LRRNETSFEDGGAEKKRRHKRTQTSESNPDGQFVNLDSTNLRQTNASTIEYLRRTPFYDEANPPMPTNNPHFFRKERVQTFSAQEEVINEQIKSRCHFPEIVKTKNRSAILIII